MFVLIKLKTSLRSLNFCIIIQKKNLFLCVRLSFKKTLTISVFMLVSASISAQTGSFKTTDSTEKSLNKKRIACIIGTEATLYAGSLIGLNELWYKNYPRSSFHFFNDNKEWLQMDKVGHFT